MTAEARETLDNVVSLRISDAQHANLKAAAVKHGLTVSDLVRIGAEMVGDMTPDELKALLACPTCKGSGRRHATR